MPKGALELPVVTEEGHQLNLLSYMRKGGELYTELHYGDIKLRSLHTHAGHRNPGEDQEMPDGHMHFPTTLYPLIGSKNTYAYEIDCPSMDSPTDLVSFFCTMLDIDLDSLQLHMDTGGRR